MKKNIIKYVMMYMAFIFGCVLFSLDIVNLFSSLLLFVGGYMSLKNTLDYRLIKRNINNFNRDNNVKVCIDNDICMENKMLGIDKINKKELISSVKSINRSVDDIVGIKRVRRYSKVRRRY